MHPEISIVTPFFNSGLYIRETIDSVLNQSYQRWELICVDDGSTDDSAAIVKEYLNKDDRIRLLQREGGVKGPSHCRNIGISAARGVYCMFLDSDDLLSPECLMNRIQSIKSGRYEFVVYPMAGFTDNIGEGKVFSHLDARHFDYYFASSVSAWPITSTLIRLDFFNKLNGFDEDLARLEDVEFHLRAILRSEGEYLVVKNTCPDCFYRITDIQHRFILEKFEASQIPLNDFIEKIILYKDSLNNKVLLSRSSLVILLNVIYVHSIVDLKGGRLVDIHIANLIPLLKRTDYVIYKIVCAIPFSRVRLGCSAIVRKLLIKTF